MSSPTRDRAALAARARQITEREVEAYGARTTKSQAANARAAKVLPLGVPSSFQFYDPYPVVARRAQASWLEDLDGNRYIDFNMGYGALFAGHSHPIMRKAIEDQLENGTLYVTPSEGNADVAELLIERFGFDLVRFTNSGTESTMDALRAAKGYTGRSKIIKVEGGYHGHHDEVMISMKPSLDLAGPADAPNPVPATGGLTPGVLHDTLVVPFNNIEALERVLDANKGEVAAFITEPVMENIGICPPDPGYLEAVRELTQRHGTMLIFDEVKTGITAGYGGATRRYGVQPDLVCLAKSIGGGLPIGAFGGRAEVMETITQGQVLHLGTYNGNPLVMAAARAVLRDICTREAVAEVEARNHRMVDAISKIIADAGLPAHTVEMGAKGCVTYSPTPVRNYRDYKNTDMDLAFANWIWGINRGILLPPGLDEQWLVSVQHTDADMDRHIQVFSEFVSDLVG
ncbi:MAG TPA: aspartate aminotransferase family protein [Acidimicrobiales bacterium]|nr:aspartate aminotransferase family protein [Acidimicrobiales bacterium]